MKNAEKSWQLTEKEKTKGLTQRNTENTEKRGSEEIRGEKSRLEASLRQAGRRYEMCRGSGAGVLSLTLPRCLKTAASESRAEARASYKGLQGK